MTTKTLTNFNNETLKTKQCGNNEKKGKKYINDQQTTHQIYVVNTKIYIMKNLARLPLRHSTRRKKTEKQVRHPSRVSAKTAEGIHRIDNKHDYVICDLFFMQSGAFYSDG